MNGFERASSGRRENYSRPYQTQETSRRGCPIEADGLHRGALGCCLALRTITINTRNGTPEARSYGAPAHEMSGEKIMARWHYPQ